MLESPYCVEKYNVCAWSMWTNNKWRICGRYAYKNRPIVKWKSYDQQRSTQQWIVKKFIVSRPVKFVWPINADNRAK